jgi:hypothetical protein
MQINYDKIALEELSPSQLPNLGKKINGGVGVADEPVLGGLSAEALTGWWARCYGMHVDSNTTISAPLDRKQK